jgi:hypothetical protein
LTSLVLSRYLSSQSLAVASLISVVRLWIALQTSYVLGANGWGSAFVVAASSDSTAGNSVVTDFIVSVCAECARCVYAGVFPFCMHHQVANLVGFLNGTGRTLLKGAVVDGPTMARVRHCVILACLLSRLCAACISAWP